MEQPDEHAFLICIIPSTRESHKNLLDGDIASIAYVNGYYITCPRMAISCRLLHIYEDEVTGMLVYWAWQRLAIDDDDCVDVCRAARPDPFLFACETALLRLCLSSHMLGGGYRAILTSAPTFCGLLRCARDVARSAYAPALAPDTGKYPSIDCLLHPQSTTTTTAYYTGNPVPNKPLNLRLPAKPGTPLQAKC
jgi:hypothetical protein